MSGPTGSSTRWAVGSFGSSPCSTADATSRTSWPGGFCADQGAGNLERSLCWTAPPCRSDRPAPPPPTGHNTSRFSRCQRFRGSPLVRPFDMREISTDPLRMHDIQGRPTVAEVSLGALRTNLRAARELVGPGVKVLAVVKADGDGHGAVAAARAFVEAGASALGVSTVEEGMELRHAGVGGPVVVLGGAFPGEAANAVAGDLEVAVWARAAADALAGAARALGRTASIHIKVETGMTRLGLDPADVGGFGTAVRDLPGLRVAGVFSHFASADAVETATARAQVERFRAAIEALAAAGGRPAD